MQTIKVIFPVVVDNGCYSHRLDLIGEKFDLPVFITLWISLFPIVLAHAQMDWRTRTGRTMKSFSPTRWWSKWEVLHDEFVLFGDVLPFVQHHVLHANCYRYLITEVNQNFSKLNL